jgi:acetolactate synthase-1/2/3 large subunit
MTYTVAQLIARALRTDGVSRVYGLCGGHVQPLWDAASRNGIRIIDVRDEGSAVLMAQAEAQLTGALGISLVTAGPGITNAVTAIANADASQAEVLVITGRPPLRQAGRGAMQEIPQMEIVRPLCRFAGSVLHRDHAMETLRSAVHAARGAGGPPGPACVEFPIEILDEGMNPSHASRVFRNDGQASAAPPDSRALEAAWELIASSRRPLVIAGRGARTARRPLLSFLELTGALYLDSAESRGAVPDDHPSAVPAVRGQALREADLVITLARRLNFQLGYGSPAVFGDRTKFLRIGTTWTETADNRLPDVELRCDLGSALEALVDRSACPRSPDLDWLSSLRAKSAAKREQHLAAMRSRQAGADGRMHPDRLLSALNDRIDDETIIVADGGDILSFARVGLRSSTFLDCGPLGCLGVGVPFATAAALTYPERKVIAVIGDGAFGFTAIELDTAVRHGAPAVYIVANNEGWNIERMDQADRYGGNLVGVELPGCRYDLLAQSLGAASRRIDEPADLPAAIDWAISNAPALLDVLITRDAESPDFKSGIPRVPLRQALATWDQAEATREEGAASVGA